MQSRFRVPKSLILMALTLLCLAAAAAIGQSRLVEVLELKSLDYRFRLLPDQKTASKDIVLIEIDDNSIKHLEPEFGRWPWPREVHAFFLGYMKRARPHSVSFDVLFAERDLRNGEGDELFVEATRETGGVIHAIYLGNQDNSAVSVAIPEELLHRFSIPSPGYFTEFIQADFPFLELARGSSSLGHISNVLDPDGPFRHYLPLATYRDHSYPSIALSTALENLGLNSRDLRIEEGRVQAEQLSIPLNMLGRVPIWFNGGPGTYESYSYSHLVYSEFQIREGMEPGLPPEIFEDKIVLIGVTASGLHELFTTPYSGSAGERADGNGGVRLGKISGLEIHANMVDNFLHNRYLSQQSRTVKVFVTGIGIFLVLLVVVYLRLWLSIGLILSLFIGYLSLAEWLFSYRYQTSIALPMLGWVLATVIGLTYQYWFEGAQKRQVKQVFSRYVSKDVFQRLLDDPTSAELGGSRTEMSVLFSDLRGFTSMSEGRNPEEIVDQLNEYFSVMVEIVFEHQGTVDKFVGDMIMALFSAPLHDPDHADHAVQCALAMRRELNELNRDWEARGLPTLQFGVGINSGEMVAGNVGSASIRSYTVIGDNVNLGARIESLCKDFQATILISEFTHSRLKLDYALEELGEVTVKGKEKPVKVFKVHTDAERNRDL